MSEVGAERLPSAAVPCGAGRVSEVAEGVHRLELPLGRRFVCVFALVGEAATLLVDCGLAGTPRALIAPALDRLGVPAEQVRHLVVTHADVDHCGGAAAARELWPAISIACHPLDRALVEDPEALLERRYRALRDDHAIDRDEAFAAWVRANGAATPVDRELSGGETIDLGGG